MNKRMRRWLRVRRWFFGLCSFLVFISGAWCLLCTSDGFYISGNPSDIGNSGDIEAQEPDTVCVEGGDVLIIDAEQGIRIIKDKDTDCWTGMKSVNR